MVDGEPNVYTLNHDGFDRLAQAATRLHRSAPDSPRTHTDAPAESATGASDARARSRGYLTSERITSHSPTARGRASQIDPVKASWAQS